MKFLPYQARWIKDESPIKLYEKTRRGGITYATSYRSCIKCLRSGERDSNFVQWVSSRDEITAKEFVTDYVAHWAREANKAARRVAAAWDGVIGLDGNNIEVVDEKHGITARVVKFKNGARIFSLSSNPLAFAGKGGDVLIDEWDLHEDQAVIYDMAYPCITWGGQLELVSAYDPDGSEHTEFAQMCWKCRNGLLPNVSFHRTTIVDAIQDGFVETVNSVKAARGLPTQTRAQFLEQLKAGCRTRSAFETQYMCVPNQASGQQLVSGADIIAAKKPLKVFRLHIEGLDELESHKELFDPAFWRTVLPVSRCALGWDIAATGDLTSMWVNRCRDDVNVLAALVTMHRCDRPSRQRKVVEAIMESSYNVVGAGDKSGLGRESVTELELAYPGRFAGVVMGLASKLELGTLLNEFYEQKRQFIPVEHPEIAADIAAVRKGKTSGGKLTFVEVKNEFLPDSHCDMCWSNALALYAGKTCESDGPCFMAPAEPPDTESAAANEWPGYEPAQWEY